MAVLFICFSFCGKEAVEARLQKLEAKLVDDPEAKTEAKSATPN